MKGEDRIKKDLKGKSERGTNERRTKEKIEKVREKGITGYVNPLYKTTIFIMK